MPSSFVDEMVVLGAEGDEVVEVRQSAGLPGLEVVRLAVTERTVAPAPSAAAVDGAKRRPLAGGCGPISAADVDRYTLGTEHDPLEHGITAEAGDRCIGQVETVGGFGDRGRMAPSLERLLIDDDGDVGKVCPSLA